MTGKWKWLWLVAVVPMLTACGYHLVGNSSKSGAHTELPTKIAVVGLTHYDPLYVAMRSVLNRHGVRVVARGKAVWQLEVQGHKVSEQVAVIGTAAGSFEYDLRLDAEVQTALKGKGKVRVLSTRHFSVYGGYPNEPNNPVASEQKRQEDLGRMRDELCEQILGHLKYLAKKYRRAA